MGVPIAEFHTFDDGKSKGIDGKTVPLLSYQEWREGFDAKQRQVSGLVVGLRRRRPIHPEPRMPFTQQSPPAAVVADVVDTRANDEKPKRRKVLLLLGLVMILHRPRLQLLRH